MLGILHIDHLPAVRGVNGCRRSWVGGGGRRRREGVWIFPPAASLQAVTGTVLSGELCDPPENEVKGPSPSSSVRLAVWSKQGISDASTNKRAGAQRYNRSTVSGLCFKRAFVLVLKGRDISRMDLK